MQKVGDGEEGVWSKDEVDVGEGRRKKKRKGKKKKKRRNEFSGLVS